MLRITSKIMTAWTKVASMTFSIAESQRIAQPMNLFSIAWELKSWAYKNLPRELLFEHPSSIDVDGHEDHHAFVGTINWYTPKNADPKAIIPYIKQSFMTELEPLEIVAVIRKFERSGMMNANVFRIDILENATQKRQQLPELNVANRNGVELQKLLGMQPQYEGSINAKELLQRINMARQQIDLYTQPGEVSGEPGRAVNYDAPLEENQLARYLDVLEQMANLALESFPKPVIQWG